VTLGILLDAIAVTDISLTFAFGCECGVAWFFSAIIEGILSHQTRMQFPIKRIKELS